MTDLAHAAEDADQPRWAIVAPLDTLLETVAEVGLDANAVRSEAETGNDRGCLLLPSFFCPEPLPWLRTLALLVERKAELQLQLIYRDPLQAEAAPFVSRLYPRLDAETRMLLHAFSPADAAMIERASDKVEEAFALLHRNITPIDIH